MLKINDEVRISDYDANQYTIERRHVVKEGKTKGEEKWKVFAYCGTLKGLSDALRRMLTQDAVDEARLLAEGLFRIGGHHEDIMALPEKPKKK